MRYIIFYLFMIFLTVSFTNCSRIIKNDERKEDIEDIRMLLQKWETTAEADDFYGCFDLYADDAIWMRPNAIVDLTKEEVMPIYHSFMKDYVFDQDLTIQEIQICGEYAFARLTADGWLKPKQNDDKKNWRAISRHLLILKKQNNGSWLIFRDIFNNPPPKEGEE